jgi:hypothetical protein
VEEACRVAQAEAEAKQASAEAEAAKAGREVEAERWRGRDSWARAGQRTSVEVARAQSAAAKQVELDRALVDEERGQLAALRSSLDSRVGNTAEACARAVAEAERMRDEAIGAAVAAQAEALAEVKSAADARVQAAEAAAERAARMAAAESMTAADRRVAAAQAECAEQLARETQRAVASVQALAQKEVETMRRELQGKARGEVDRALQWLGFKPMDAPPVMGGPVTRRASPTGTVGGEVAPGPARVRALPGEPGFDREAFERYRLRSGSVAKGGGAPDKVGAATPWAVSLFA